MIIISLIQEKEAEDYSNTVKPSIEHILSYLFHYGTDMLLRDVTNDCGSCSICHKYGRWFLCRYISYSRRRRGSLGRSMRNQVGKREKRGGQVAGHICSLHLFHSIFYLVLIVHYLRNGDVNILKLVKFHC